MTVIMVLNVVKMKLFSNTYHRDHWQRVLNKAPKHTFKKGESILLQGQEPPCVYIIKSGLVRVYNITREGEERPVSFDTTLDIFPLGWIFDSLEKTQYFYQAFTECEVYQLNKEDFLRYCQHHPKMAYEIYAGIASRFVNLQMRIYALEQPKASTKILYTLAYLADQFGKKIAHGTTALLIPLTQQELANFIGLTRETTSSELKKLERKKILRFKNKRYYINSAKLKALLDTL